MSRSAAAVAGVIKAYDVVASSATSSTRHRRRTSVPPSPGWCARTPRQVVVGYDMREILAGAVGGVRRRRRRPGPRRRRRIGLASTDLLYFASGLAGLPGRDVHRQPQPGRLQRHQVVPGRRQPSARTPGWPPSATSVDRRRAGPRRPAPHRHVDRDVLADYGAFLRSLVDLSAIRPLRVAVDAGNGMAGLTAPAVFGAISSVDGVPLYFELDGTFPNHEANPLDPANLVDLQRFVRRDRCRYRPGVRRRRRPLLRRRRARRAGVAVGGDRHDRRARADAKARRHRDPQPDHLAGGA